MHIVTADGSNFRNLEYLVSALTPGTEAPASDEPTQGVLPLIVTMVTGDAMQLRGRRAEAYRRHLLAVSLPDPAISPPAEPLVTYGGRRVPAESPPGSAAPDRVGAAPE